MNEEVLMDFSESVLAGVHAAITGALPCDASPVKNTLVLLLSGQNLPIRALVASSLHFDPSAIKAGAALDLIHAGLQRLHARIARTEGVTAFLGTGATILVGDYLTTGAFRLLVGCADMRLLALAADAVNQASELEAARLGMEPSEPASPQDLRRLAAPLSIAAGAMGATLAGYPKSLAANARLFGDGLATSHVLLREAEDLAPGPARALLHGAARDLCHHAAQAAEIIAAATGNRRPGELAEWIATGMAAVR